MKLYLKMVALLTKPRKNKISGIILVHVWGNAVDQVDQLKFVKSEIFP